MNIQNMTLTNMYARKEEIFARVGDCTINERKAYTEELNVLNEEISAREKSMHYGVSVHRPECQALLNMWHATMTEAQRKLLAYYMYIELIELNPLKEDLCRRWKREAIHRFQEYAELI